ncbi:hypothetical protein AWR27_11895 [Spirosoma montaniterrae]|uniref:PKD domain-containing protein n=1 Tax=Spirosoma montaniterrae TaxID=1178516 RepID=A0A1P9X484_9BACT|nr:hypothetical protein AWR27_11895 [Spirosoma montaniterrae]
MFAVALFATSLFAQTLPTGFNNSVVQNGYTTPMGVVFSTDSRQLFVWDKAGRVWVSVWNGSQYVRQSTPVLDISDEVGNWRDFGLLSLCLDPNFAQNGRIYLFYVVDRHHLFNAGTAQYNPATNQYFAATISRLTRYRVNTASNVLTADPASRFVLLGESRSTGVPLTHESHAGGTVLFGRDGTLLVSTGDNASYASTDKGSATETYFQQAIDDGIMRANENVGAFRSQMTGSLCGKILRLDPETGDGVSNNPFFDTGNARSAQSRVWSLGFRNPCRMALEPNTGSTNPADANPGTLLVGDVGWNVWEDFHRISRPAENAGWPMFEGLDPHSGYMQAAQTLQNLDEPNPANTCNKPFLTFQDLLKQAQNEAQGTLSALNPCSQQPLPGPQRRYFHSRPALDWKHGADVARYPTFSGNTATATTLGSVGAAVPGNSFRGNCATAGACYTGTRYPDGYRNAYYFADYGANWIRAATLGPNGVTQVRDFAPNGFGRGIIDIEYNALDESLYYVNINSGEIMRISYGGNRPPVAAIVADKLTGNSPLTVNFKGDASTDPDGDVLTYLWDFGDGTTSTQANPVKTFTSATARGFTVKLTVSDGRGLTAQEQVTVSVNNAVPVVRITSPANNSAYPLDRESQYTLAATVTDDDATGLAYAWQVTLRHNNHEHREPILTNTSPTVTLSPVGCDGETYYYVIKLTVTDQGGLTASDSVRINPDCSSGNLSVANLKATPQDRAASVSWTNPAVSFDQIMLVAKEGSGFLDKPSGTNFVADANFGGSGTAQEGGKVVYRGTGTSVTVTGLTNGKTYYFRAYTLKGTAWNGGTETSTTPVASTPPPPPPPPPVPTFVPDPAKCYRLTARVSGRALEVDNGATTDGAVVRQRTYATRTWQQWKFQDMGSQFYRLTALHSGKALDVNGASTSDGAAIIQWTPHQNANQQWKVQGDNQGYFSLIARHSAKALQVQNNSTADGAAMVQFTANGTSAQQWTIDEVGCTTTAPPTSNSLVFNATTCYRLTARVSGKVLEVNNGSTGNGAALVQRTNSNKAWQQWRLRATSSGFYRLVAVHSGKAADVNAASTADWATVIQWPVHSGTNQEWRPQINADGFYTLMARHSQKMLDVRNGETGEGIPIIQYMPNGTVAQQWRIEPVGCLSGARVGDLASVNDLFFDTEQAFRVFPNPAQQYVDVDLRAAQGQPVRLSLTDAAGKVVQQADVNEPDNQPYRLTVSHLNSGLYLIDIETNGQERVVRRLLISR